MRVSVLVPVFNTAKYIGMALQSVISQSYRDFEIIVVDDGSADGSLSIVRELARHEPRLKVFSRPNQGLIATRNELLGRATGDLIAWMDSDDIAHTDRLQSQVVALDSDPTLVCVGAYAQCIDPEGELLNLETYPVNHDEIHRHQLRGGGMRFPTTIMRRTAAISAGGFRRPFAMGEDLDFLLRVGEKGRLANIGSVLYFYRQHIASVCATLGPCWQGILDAILELARQRRTEGIDVLQAGGSLNLPLHAPESRHKAIASIYSAWANSALAHGDRIRAMRYLGQALMRNPLSRPAWVVIAKRMLPLTNSGVGRSR